MSELTGVDAFRFYFRVSKSESNRKATEEDLRRMRAARKIEKRREMQEIEKMFSL